MNTQSLVRQSIRLYPRTSYAGKKAVNALRRGWIRQVIYLGPKWLLHPDNAIQRKQAGHVGDLAVFWITVPLGILALVLL